MMKDENITETEELPEFEIFDYRDVINVLAYTLMSTGMSQNI